MLMGLYVYNLQYYVGKIVLNNYSQISGSNEFHIFHRQMTKWITVQSGHIMASCVHIWPQWIHFPVHFLCALLLFYTFRRSQLLRGSVCLKKFVATHLILRQSPGKLSLVCQDTGSCMPQTESASSLLCQFQLYIQKYQVDTNLIPLK